MTVWKSLKVAVLAAALCAGSRAVGAQAVITNADGIIRNSLCVGFDCPGGIAFSDTTILLMENNTRIKFDDTSVAASFPRNDWELEANSNLNGGPSHFALNDCGSSSQGGCVNDPVFVVEAGARANALFIDSSGDIGFGTSTPVVDLHSVNGNTPTLRLDQNGSSGFAPQIWDVAGNEASFFVRDVTNGSTLPFRIRPGAFSNALVIDGEGDIGVGTLSASHPLHVRRSDGTARALIEEASVTVSERTLFQAQNNGQVRFTLTNGDQGFSWDFKTAGGSADARFQVSLAGSGAVELDLNNQGDLTLTGDVITSNCPSGCGPDYVFDETYDLMSLKELETFIRENRHLPRIPSAGDMQARGVNMTTLQLQMLEKVEELTLYAIELEKMVDSLGARVKQLEGTVSGS